MYFNIGDAYFNVLKLVREKGRPTNIATGSYEGELQRRQVPFIAFTIKHPLDFGWLADPNLPVSITSEQVDNYFSEYIINSGLHGNESYTYGSRIWQQLPEVITKLDKGPTNQAAISISQPSDIKLQDPPCWRELVFNVNTKLDLVIFARSWDVFNALPLNLSGFAKLLEYVAGFLPDLSPGKLHVSAANAHYYSNCEKFVKEYLDR